MLRKVLHLAYHFVTVADEIPRHIGHTSSSRRSGADDEQWVTCLSST